MFCKNCGREIDRKTLEKLIRPTGEPALCPNCGQVLDTAEFCGGFWGLIASGEAMNGTEGAKAGRVGDGNKAGHRNAGDSGGKGDSSGSTGSVTSRKRAGIPGVTEADRVFARLILGGEDPGEDLGGAAAGTAAGAAVRGSIRTNEPVASRNGSNAGTVKAGGDNSKKSEPSAARNASNADTAKAGPNAVRSEKKAGETLKTSEKTALKAASAKSGGNAAVIGKETGNIAKTAAAGAAGSKGGNAAVTGKEAGNNAKTAAAGAAGSKEGKSSGADGSGKRGRNTQPWLISAALALVAVIAGFLIGRVLPRSSGSETTAGTEIAQTASTVNADALVDSGTAEEETENGEDSIIPADTAGENAGIGDTVEAMADSAGSGATAAAADGKITADGGYNKIRRSLTDVGGTLVEDAVLYLGTQDSGIVFDGEKLSNEWLSTADGTAYIRKEIKSADGLPEEIQEIYCDSSGVEKNNSAGFSRVKYEYNSEGILEKKKYYAVTADGEKNEKIFTAECGTVETDDGTVAVEIIKPEKEEAENSAFLYRKIERTFMSEDSDLPGAIEAVRYYAGENDSVAAKEEIHEYSRMDESPSDDAGYDYYVEETIKSVVRSTGAETGSENPGTGESAGQETGISDADNSGNGISDTDAAETAFSGADNTESDSSGTDVSGTGISGTAEHESENSQADASEAGISGQNGSDTENQEAGISGTEIPGQDSAESNTSGTAESGAAGTTAAAADREAAGEELTEEMSEITIRYFFETVEEQTRLVGMGFYEDGRSISGDAGFSYLSRSYNENGTVIEDTFFAESEETDSENGIEPAVLTSEEPLLSGSVTPGWISKDRPWMFLIP